MSSVALLVGQCGNQIGHELMKVIDSSELHPLGHRDGKLRCVCVDSEPKVIHRNTQEDLRSAGLYRDGNAVIGQRGRGNNWALGYYGPPSDTEETSLLHRSMETLRKEVERCDCYAVLQFLDFNMKSLEIQLTKTWCSGTIVLHSLTGGTGSGLGSHLVESIRDAYPLAHVMSVAIAPHISGDSPLQHYNSLLSLATLQRSADGVILFSNDDVLHHVMTHSSVVGKQHSTSSGAISLKHMNSYIASCLAGVLQPLGNKPRSESCKYTMARDKTVKSKSGRSTTQWSQSLSRVSTLSKNTSVFEESGVGKRGVIHSRKDKEESACFSGTAGLARNLFSASLGHDESIAAGNSSVSFTSTSSSGSLMAQQPRSSGSALRRYRDAANQTYLKPSSQTPSQEKCQSNELATAVSAGSEPWEMLRSVCPEPSKKFVAMHHTAKAKVSWAALAQSLIHSTRRYSRDGVQFSTISSLLVARGDHDGTFSDSADKIEEKLKSAFGCVEWNPFPVDFWISKHNPLGTPGSKSLTLCQNSSSIVETLGGITSKAKAMYKAGAYLHWYWKHGCSQSDFMEAFDTLDTVVEEYRTASV